MPAVRQGRAKRKRNPEESRARLQTCPEQNRARLRRSLNQGRRRQKQALEQCRKALHLRPETLKERIFRTPIEHFPKACHALFHCRVRLRSRSFWEWARN